MANQKRNRLLALALALCLALGMLLPAGQVNAEGRSAGILTEVTGQEREQLASLAQPGDLILTVGAGDIYKVGEKLKKLEADA